MRHNFSTRTKKAALARSGGRCEAVGVRYGHQPGHRCNADLSVTGVEHDHFPLGAHAENSDTLENDVVCCPACNQYAANHFDKAIEAKIKRIRRANGDPALRRKTPHPIRTRKTNWPSRKMLSRPMPRKGRT